MPITSFTERIKKRLLKGQIQYDFDGNFDRIIKVRRLAANMVDVIDDLIIIEFPDDVETEADTIPPTHSCYFRTGNGTSTVYIRDDETQPESAGITYLEVTLATTFCRATVDSTTNINLLKAAEKNASNGIRIMRVDRPDIDTVQGCIDVATALKNEFEKIPVTVSFQTRQKGLKIGQTFEYTSPTDNEIFILTIANMETSWSLNDFLFNVTIEYVVLKSVQQRKKEVLRNFHKPITERKTIIDPDYVV